MEIRELVRYYLLAISVRFIILTRIVDESSIRNGGQKMHLKNRLNLFKLALFYEFQQQINNKMCKFHQLFK